MSKVGQSKEARKKRLQARLARVEGQIRAIRRMIDEDQSCEVVAQQLAASRTAISKAFCEMMACALEHEIDEKGALDEDARQKLSELTQLLTKYG